MSWTERDDLEYCWMKDKNIELSVARLNELQAELSRLAAENTRLREALGATIEYCDTCDSTGILESYPPAYSGGFDGAGNAVVEREPCPRCHLAREALAQK